MLQNIEINNHTLRPSNQTLQNVWGFFYHFLKDKHEANIVQHAENIFFKFAPCNVTIA